MKTIFLKCNNCQKGFERLEKFQKQRISEGSQHTFCSTTCAREYLIKERNQILHCICCQKAFKRNISEIKRVKNHFCSQSCAASYNNKFSPKRKLDLSRTLQSYRKDNYRTYKTRINDLSRKIYIAAQKPLSCHICNYTAHIEVAHIKAIKTFPMSATIGEVNDLTNLVALCPNHHWEYDNGLILLQK